MCCYQCLHIYIYIYYAHITSYNYVYTPMKLHICTNIRSYTCTCAHICLQHVHAHICLCTMCMYMYLYAIINLSARIITCIYKDIHMYIYICYILLYTSSMFLEYILRFYDAHVRSRPLISSRSMKVA